MKDKIKISITVSSDKVLHIKATCGEQQVMVEPLSPFANKELTARERIIYRAERTYNLACQKNGGGPTADTLKILYQVYCSQEQHFKAAEVLELMADMFPDKASFNNIGLSYSNAGKKSKALKFYMKSMASDPSATTAFNLAIQYKYSDPDKFKEFLEKAQELDPKHVISKFCLGRLYHNDGEQAGKDMILEACKIWERRFSKNKMREFDYGWFESCARELEKWDLVEQIKSARKSSDSSQLFRDENLTIRENPIEKLKN